MERVEGAVIWETKSYRLTELDDNTKGSVTWKVLTTGEKITFEISTDEEWAFVENIIDEQCNQEYSCIPLTETKYVR